MKLRRIREEDLRALFTARNDPELYRWCRQYAPLHWSSHVDWYHWQAKDPKTEMFVMEIYSDFYNDDVILGVCGLTSIDFINRRAEFSLYIVPEYWGHGHGRDGLKLLLDFGFNTLGLNRIWGETFDGNGAVKTFEALGMELEGTRKEHYFRNGSFINAHLYSIGAQRFNHLFASEELRPSADS